MLAITEHWKSIEELKIYNIINYNLSASFCRGKREHGGVAIFTRKDVVSVSRSDLEGVAEERVFECAATEVRIARTRLVVVVIYRPPESRMVLFFDKLNMLLSLLVSSGEIFVIAGDFNIDIKKDTKDKQSFIAVLDSYNVNVTINEYTRITKNSKSCIDNILTNIKVEYEAAVLQSHMSDHSNQRHSGCQQIALQFDC